MRQLEHAGLLLLLYQVLLPLPNAGRQLRWWRHAQQALPQLLLQALTQLQSTQQHSTTMRSTAQHSTTQVFYQCTVASLAPAHRAGM